jgi:hypothetical protein
VDGAQRGRPGRSAGVALACVLVAAAGCGGGSAPAPIPPTPTATPEEQALAWTESVCAAVVPMVAQLRAAPAVRLDATAETRQAYLAYLNDSLATTDRARAALAAAGPAPVPGGDAIAEQVRGDVADLRADLVDARTQVERSDPGSAVSLGRALVGGGKLVSALLNGAQVGGTINRDPVLHDAYDRAPSCAQLQRSAATATPTPGSPPTR